MGQYEKNGLFGSRVFLGHDENLFVLSVRTFGLDQDFQVRSSSNATNRYGLLARALHN